MVASEKRIVIIDIINLVEWDSAAIVNIMYHWHWCNQLEQLMALNPCIRWPGLDEIPIANMNLIGAAHFVQWFRQ